eukprot:ctg_92.g66
MALARALFDGGVQRTLLTRDVGKKGAGWTFRCDAPASGVAIARAAPLGDGPREPSATNPSRTDAVDVTMRVPRPACLIAIRDASFPSISSLHAHHDEHRERAVHHAVIRGQLQGRQIQAVGVPTASAALGGRAHRHRILRHLPLRLAPGAERVAECHVPDEGQVQGGRRGRRRVLCGLVPLVRRLQARPGNTVLSASGDDLQRARKGWRAHLRWLCARGGGRLPVRVAHSGRAGQTGDAAARGTAVVCGHHYLLTVALCGREEGIARRRHRAGWPGTHGGAARQGHGLRGEPVQPLGEQAQGRAGAAQGRPLRRLIGRGGHESRGRTLRPGGGHGVGQARRAAAAGAAGARGQAVHAGHSARAAGDTRQRTGVRTQVHIRIAGGRHQGDAGDVGLLRKARRELRGGNDHARPDRRGVQAHGPLRRQVPLCDRRQQDARVVRVAGRREGVDRQDRAEAVNVYDTADAPAGHRCPPAPTCSHLHRLVIRAPASGPNRPGSVYATGRSR